MLRRHIPSSCSDKSCVFSITIAILSVLDLTLTNVTQLCVSRIQSLFLIFLEYWPINIDILW